jgi:hypothetical protein
MEFAKPLFNGTFLLLLLSNIFFAGEEDAVKYPDILVRTKMASTDLKIGS